MNNEIMEILDRLERIDHKEYSGGFEFADSGSFDEDCRCFEERKKMADYITNLQKENYELNRMCELYGKSLYYAELKDYKSRCKKAIEYMQNYIEVEELNEPVKIEFKEVMNILDGGDK